MKKIFFSLLMLMSFSGFCQSVDMSDWTRIHLPDLIVRIAPVMANYTNDTNWEVCSPIGVNENGDYAVSLISSGSSLGCIIYLENLPEGFAHTGMSVHSHPGVKNVIPNDMDKKIASFHGRRLANRVRNQSEGFSPDDFAAGPGYLITPTQVLHQEGFKTVRRVGRL